MFFYQPILGDLKDCREQKISGYSPYCFQPMLFGDNVCPRGPHDYSIQARQSSVDDLYKNYKQSCLNNLAALFK